MLTINSIDLCYGAAQARRKVSVKALTGKVTCVLGRDRASMDEDDIRRRMSV